jgi:hypothetical protein
MRKLRLASVTRLLIGSALLVARSMCLAESVGQDGRIHLDVVVSDGSGKPVQGLQAKDFTLFDEGKERQIATFAAFDGVTATTYSVRKCGLCRSESDFRVPVIRHGDGACDGECGVCGGAIDLRPG